MGPSGAGKTTLLNTLMGKVDPSFKQTGELRINDKLCNIKDFRAVIGFVPQEDIMMRELTVRDNIEYSARTRLPPTWTDAEIKQHVDAVLDALSLAHVQHTRIGDEKTRGVSGGQRKRVNIGIEVAACPVALYLDEPTSGLDSTAALEVTDALKNIAHATGITVAMVIHQPRYEIWAALDEVLFLAPGGRTVFLGNLKEVEPYFQSKMVGQSVHTTTIDHDHHHRRHHYHRICHQSATDPNLPPHTPPQPHQLHQPAPPPSSLKDMIPSERDNPADFYMDRIAEDGDRCVEVWKANVNEDGEERGSIAAAALAQRRSSEAERLNRGSTTDRMTIGTGVNTKLQAMTTAGRNVNADDLEEVSKRQGLACTACYSPPSALRPPPPHPTPHTPHTSHLTPRTTPSGAARRGRFWRRENAGETSGRVLRQEPDGLPLQGRAAAPSGPSREGRAGGAVLEAVRHGAQPLAETAVEQADRSPLGARHRLVRRMPDGFRGEEPVHRHPCRPLHAHLTGQPGHPRAHVRHVRR